LLQLWTTVHAIRHTYNGRLLAVDAVEMTTVHAIRHTYNGRLLAVDAVEMTTTDDK